MQDNTQDLGVDGAEGFIDPETQQGQDDAFAQILSSLLSSVKPFAPGVEERYNELGLSVDSVMNTLDDESQAGHSHDYVVTLTTDQARWALAALGWFVDNEVADKGEIAFAVMDAAEQIVNACNLVTADV